MISYSPTRPDFWNDPRLWDGITDPRKQMCWMDREVSDATPRLGYVRVALLDGSIQHFHHSEVLIPTQERAA